MFVKKNTKGFLTYVKCEKASLSQIRKFYCLLKTLIEQFMEMQVNKGLDLIQFAEYFKCDISNSILISHTNGTALCDVEIDEKDKNVELFPYLLISPNINTKISFLNKEGHIKIMSDENDVYFECIKLSKHCELFVLWIVFQIEKLWETKFADDLVYNISLSKIDILEYETMRSFEKIEEELNLSDDENSLDREKLKNYLIENVYDSPQMSDVDVFKICLNFKISPYLAKKYILLYLPIVYVKKLKGGNL